MRRILIDDAVERDRSRPAEVCRRVYLENAEITLDQTPDDLLALEDAITRLVADDSVAAELAKLRLFAGLTVDEAAETLGMSRRTGFRHWTYARAFLQLQLQTTG